MISLLTMGQGNVKVLKQTLDSVKGVCNEVIYGDLLIFEEDRGILKNYQEQYNLKIIPFEFNFIFRMGFSPLLNILASHATNDYCLYLNTGEIIESGAENILPQVSSSGSFYNAYCFNHRTDPHLWYRLFNRNQLGWSGLIHEQLSGEDYRPCPLPLFTMADLEKDMDNEFKARVFNDIKELVYFNLYIRLADIPQLLGATNPGWVGFAIENRSSFMDRINKKGGRYGAFANGDYEKYIDAAINDPEFEFEKFESSIKIEFQGDKKFLL